MNIVNTVKEMQYITNEIRKNEKTISFLPTMGALHDAHLNLISKAREISDTCVVSIFVNPTQFGPNEDFEKYTRDIEGDLIKLRDKDVDIAFVPELEEIYPKGFQTFVEVQELGNHLCGLFREGHFRGVATIVLKLFNIVKPDIAIFGEKDYQQLKIIQRMVKDLNLEVEILSFPIVRDKDGLALSSRNSYLSGQSKVSSCTVFRALTEIKRRFEEGSRDCKYMTDLGREILREEKILDIDYFEICDPETLESRELAESGDLLAIAVRIGETRLIDNMRL